MKLLLPLLLTAVSLGAQPAWFTAKGHVWHASPTCSALSRSKNVLTADSSAAEAHGLTECSICAHRHATAPAKAKANDSWARPAGETAK